MIEIQWGSQDLNSWIAIRIKSDQVTVSLFLRNLCPGVRIPNFVVIGIWLVEKLCGKTHGDLIQHLFTFDPSKL